MVGVLLLSARKSPALSLCYPTFCSPFLLVSFSGKEGRGVIHIYGIAYRGPPPPPQSRRPTALITSRLPQVRRRVVNNSFSEKASSLFPFVCIQLDRVGPRKNFPIWLVGRPVARWLAPSLGLPHRSLSHCLRPSIRPRRGEVQGA